MWWGLPRTDSGLIFCHCPSKCCQSRSLLMEQHKEESMNMQVQLLDTRCVLLHMSSFSVCVCVCAKDLKFPHNTYVNCTADYAWLQTGLNVTNSGWYRDLRWAHRYFAPSADESQRDIKQNAFLRAADLQANPPLTTPDTVTSSIVTAGCMRLLGQSPCLKWLLPFLVGKSQRLSEKSWSPEGFPLQIYQADQIQYFFLLIFSFILQQQ